MKYKLFTILILLFFVQPIFSQKYANGVYKGINRNSSFALYKSNNRILFVDGDEYIGGTYKEIDNKLTFDLLTEFELKAFCKQNSKIDTDSISISFYNPYMDANYSIKNDQAYILSLPVLDENRNPSQTKRVTIKREKSIDVLVDINEKLKQYTYSIPSNVNEIIFLLKKDLAKKESTTYSLTAGKSLNQVIVDEKSVFYYVRPFDLQEQKAPKTNGFKKFDFDTVKNDITYIIDTLAVEEAFAVVDSTQLNIAETDSLDLFLSDTVSVATINEVPSEKYLKDVTTFTYGEESLNLSELCKKASNENKLVRIYYNTDIKLKLGEKYLRDNTSQRSISPFYLIHKYEKKDFNKLKALKIEDVPQIIIISPNGEVLYKERTSTAFYTKNEEEDNNDGVIRVYKTYLRMIGEKMKSKISETNPQIDLVRAYLKNTNTLLAALGMEWEQPQIEKDALIYDFDCVKYLGKDTLVLSYITDYLSMNYTYSLAEAKIPEAVIYLMRYSEALASTDVSDSDMLINTIISNSPKENISSQMLETVIDRVPRKAKLLLSLYVYNFIEKNTSDSLNTSIEFFNKYDTAIASKSLLCDSLEQFDNNYSLYLNYYAWNIYLQNLTDYFPLAMQWINKAIDIESTPILNDTKAHILYRLGKNADAIDLQEKVVKEYLKSSDMIKGVLFDMKLDLELMKLGIL